MTAGSPNANRWQSWAALALLFFVYFSVAAAVFNGFYQKWGLRDREARYSFAQMMEGTAHKPFVYRQLLPQMAHAAAWIVPDAFEERLKRRLSNRQWWELRPFMAWLDITDEVREKFFIQYLFVYFGSFAALVAAMFVLREIALTVEAGQIAATVAPPVFALAFQYFLSMGGFFYDFTELLFMAAAALIALRHSVLWLLPVAVLATWNKESFLFFVVSLVPLLAIRHSLQKALMTAGGMVLLAGCSYLLVRHLYASNSGRSAESWLMESFEFYATPANYFAMETNWGILAPRAFSMIGLLFIALVVKAAWPLTPRAFQQHALLAALINFPLVLVFCGPGEMRNFSLCYVALFIFLTQTIACWARSNSPPA